ncbi:MAG: SDR family oxidoreductase [Ignavibacterium sp.]|uniref:SDR family oxidoreductase n=1 Tax=Ignavibacterium sp. TaxID=2651167 RepID=UPI00404A237D
MDFGIRGKVAIVTASSTGIGKAIAESLISEGANVAICSRSKEKLIEASKDIKNKFGTEPFWYVCDINSLKDIENFYSAVKNQFGDVDILVNNCGGPIPGFFSDLTEDDWNDAFKQVLLSAIRFSHLVLPDMIKKEWGRIINITSVAVKQPVHNLILSNSFRAAVTGFAKTLSNEVANKNITVNNVAPGYTLTHRLYELAVNRAKTSGKSHEEILVEMAKDVPMNRLGSPEEIAALVTFLASKQASYITGTTIQVDGGSTKGIF